LSNPNPSTGDQVCQAVGTAVQAANGQVTKAQQEVACVQGQLSNPNPATGDQVCQAVGTAVQSANHALQLAVAQIQFEVSDAERRATARTLVCVLQGRWYHTPAAANGVSDCFVYDGSNPTDVSAQGHQGGTFSLQTPVFVSAALAASPVLSGTSGGPATSFSGAISAGSVVQNLYLISYFGPLYVPTNGDDIERPVYAVFHLLNAGDVDPNGNGDYFVNGVVALPTQ
jgi:hypothetical protein